MRIQIIQIPPQAAEDILSRLDEQIEFSAALLVHPVDVTLHVPLRVPRADDGHFGLQELRNGFFPFVRAGRMAQTRVEEYHAVQVRVEWLEIVRLVHCVEVVHVRGDLHLPTQSVFHDAAEGIARRSFGEWEFLVAVGHALRTDEDEVEERPREDMAQLQPHIARQRRFGSCTQDE